MEVEVVVRVDGEDYGTTGTSGNGMLVAVDQFGDVRGVSTGPVTSGGEVCEAWGWLGCAGER